MTIDVQRNDKISPYQKPSSTLSLKPTELTNEKEKYVCFLIHTGTKGWYLSQPAEGYKLEGTRSQLLLMIVRMGYMLQ